MGKRWTYRTFKNENNERWAFVEILNKKESSPINFWHIMDGTTLLFTFEPNENYNKDTIWTEDIIRKFESDLKSPKPSAEVLRCVYNGKVLFATERFEGKKLPKAPRKPNRPNGWERHIDRQESKLARLAIEEAKGNEPAPYILYGKHDNVDKEFAWNLTPDKPKRQGISIGDRVLVWTKKGFKEITVTRIEEADGTVRPTARVKKKL